jgi:hypothetical protein
MASSSAQASIRFSEMFDQVEIMINPTRRLHMCRIVLMLTLLALGTTGCSNSQTAGQPGYSDTEGTSLLAPAEYSTPNEERNHMDDYLPKGMGSR